MAANCVMKKFVLVLILLAVILSIFLPGCRRKPTEDEKLYIERFSDYCLLLEDYKRSFMCYPDSWDTLLRWKDVRMPENIYTEELMICLDSPEFDPETSPGNFYYITVVQDDCVINCQVILFGEKREIWRYSHAGPFAAR